MESTSLLTSPLQMDGGLGLDAPPCSRALINQQRRNRRRIKFRNCFCGAKAVKVMDSSFLCQKHWEYDRQRQFQDPAETAENIRRSNIESEKRRYARLKQSGLCVTCAKRPNYFGCVRCESCQEKRRELKRRSKGKPLPPLPIHPWKAANKILFRTSAA